MSTKNCNRCKKDLSDDSFKKKKNGEYLVNCIQCNLSISANKRKSILAKKVVDVELEDNQRKCFSCYSVKLLTEFNKKKSGYTKTCTECLSKKSKPIIQYISELEKKCNRCLKTKAVDQFDTVKNGISAGCSECNKFSREFQRKRKEKLLESTPAFDKDIESCCIKCLEIKPLDSFKVLQNDKRIKTCMTCCDTHMTYLKKSKL